MYNWIWSRNPTKKSSMYWCVKFTFNRWSHLFTEKTIDLLFTAASKGQNKIIGTNKCPCSKLDKKCMTICEFCCHKICDTCSEKCRICNNIYCSKCTIYMYAAVISSQYYNSYLITFCFRYNEQDTLITCLSCIKWYVGSTVTF